MPVTYACDHCGASMASLDSALIISVQFIRMDPTQSTPPGGRTLDATAPDLLFHAAACRDAWCEQAGLPVPTHGT